MLELVVLCIFLDSVLWQFTVASKTLQKESISTVLRFYTGLENFLKSLRDGYDSYKEEAKMILTITCIKTDADQSGSGLCRNVRKMRIIDISLPVTNFELIHLQLF